MTTLNRYYQQELSHLRQLAGEFAQRNPALAPMLSSETTADPDVERLLEGVAFLTGLLRQRIDDEFPEFVQELAQIVFPHYLRPVPCMTMLVFEPRGRMGGATSIPAGTEIASVPVDGVQTRFRTTTPVTVEPLHLQGVEWEGSGGQERTLRLDFAFDDMLPDAWTGDRIRLFLGDSYGDAVRWFHLLTREVRALSVFAAEGGESLLLGPNAFELAGFAPDNYVVPYPDHAYPGFRLLQEYFALPEKYLFLDLVGLSRWKARGSGRFSVRVRFNRLPEWTPEVRASSFLLNVAPSINLFEQDAQPIRLDHRYPEYRVAPSARGQNTHVYSVDQVLGYRQNGQEVEYAPFTWFKQGQPGYSLRYRPSPLERDVDCYLSVPYQAGQKLETETLSLHLTCTHGTLPESLKIGDICEPSDRSPERFRFRNLRHVTPYRAPPLGEALLWRMISHLSCNYLSMGSVETLHSLLSLYVFDGRGEHKTEQANRKVIEGIEAVSIEHERRLVRGMPVEGSRIRLSCRGDHYLNLSSLYLFGCVLDEFFAGYAALNTFTAFSVIDSLTGETLTWPARIGRQRLI